LPSALEVPWSAVQLLYVVLSLEDFPFNWMFTVWEWDDYMF